MIPRGSVVRSPSIRTVKILPAAERAPILIAIGLAMLLAAAWWPAIPVITAMSILGLGATDATLVRYRGTPALVPIVLLHAATYVGLYGLFIGATLHAAGTVSPAGLGLWSALDLAASAFPMAIAMQCVGAMLSRR